MSKKGIGWSSLSGRLTMLVEFCQSTRTGGSASDIDGLIKANGNANLFLINPNGIIFGANARLDIGGSFLATTADSIFFEDNSQFSATAPQSYPLLNVSVPIGLQFGEKPGKIVNNSQVKEVIAPMFPPLTVGIKVDDGKTIALVGSGITLDNGVLTALQGRVELGSVAANSFVDLTQNSQDFILSYDSVNQFERIDITNSQISTDTFIDSPSGNIKVYGGVIDLNDSVFFSINLSRLDGGEIFINAESLTLRDSQISTRTFGEGKAGNINVNANSLELIKY